jgi:hypothetical protein
MNTNDPRLSKKAQKWLNRGYLEYSCPVSDLDKYGVYHIKGEDPNCDFGGSHHEPDLGYLEGPLWAVINEAVELSGFFSWGGGGKVLPGNPPKVQTVRATMSEDDKKLFAEFNAAVETVKALQESLKAKGYLPED